MPEQTQHDTDIKIAWGDFTRCGQRLTITDRKLTKTAFVMRKVGSPAGQVYFQLWRISPSELIYDQLVGAANDLPTTDSWVEKALDTPQTIDEEVRMVAYATESDPDNYVVVRVMLSDVKPDEYMTRATDDTFLEDTLYDTAYRYTYEEVEVGLENKSAGMAAKMMARGLI